MGFDVGRVLVLSAPPALAPISPQLVDSTVPLLSWNDLFIARRVSSQESH